jgi:nicotinamidase-related amidase
MFADAFGVKPRKESQTMLKHDDVTLVVIDLQDSLLPKIQNGEAVVEKSVKLIQFARILELPIIWTEQYPKGLGPTTERVAKELQGLPSLPKTSFSCFMAPEFEEAVSASGRRQLLVFGVEAHICIMQTVLAGLSRGLEMYVPADAVGSRMQTECEAGLARMRAHGAEIVTTEMAMFEILRFSGTPEFKKVLPLFK